MALNLFMSTFGGILFSIKILRPSTFFRPSLMNPVTEYFIWFMFPYHCWHKIDYFSQMSALPSFTFSHLLISLPSLFEFFLLNDTTIYILCSVAESATFCYNPFTITNLTITAMVIPWLAAVWCKRHYYSYFLHRIHMFPRVLLPLFWKIK